MRVSGQFASLEEACREALDAAGEGEFNPDKFQLFSDPIPALMWASATLLLRGILVAVFVVPDEVREALGLPDAGPGGAWAVGLPDTVLTAFDEACQSRGADDLARH